MLLESEASLICFSVFMKNRIFNELQQRVALNSFFAAVVVVVSSFFSVFIIPLCCCCFVEFKSFSVFTFYLSSRLIAETDREMYEIHNNERKLRRELNVIDDDMRGGLMNRCMSCTEFKDKCLQRKKREREREAALINFG